MSVILDKRKFREVIGSRGLAGLSGGRPRRRTRTHVVQRRQRRQRRERRKRVILLGWVDREGGREGGEG